LLLYEKTEGVNTLTVEFEVSAKHFVGEGFAHSLDAEDLQFVELFALHLVCVEFVFEIEFLSPVLVTEVHDHDFLLRGIFFKLLDTLPQCSSLWNFP
jgi:hypothetical protein